MAEGGGDIQLDLCRPRLNHSVRKKIIASTVTLSFSLALNSLILFASCVYCQSVLAYTSIFLSFIHWAYICMCHKCLLIIRNPRTSQCSHHWLWCNFSCVLCTYFGSPLFGSCLFICRQFYSVPTLWKKIVDVVPALSSCVVSFWID